MKKLICSFLILSAVFLQACSVIDRIPAAGEDIKLRVHFIDVGQGDSTLLESDGEFVLIDAGEHEYGEEVLSYIQRCGAESLKYVIATHPHSDHIGGLRTVIKNLSADNFITVETDCDTYPWLKLLQTADDLDINYIDAEVGDTYSFGSAEFTVYAPLSDDYEGYNNYSVVTKVVCSEISFMLTGDAERESEYEMVTSGMNLDADVLKCGHHGSSTSTSTCFLQAVNPAFAVISCGEDNEYGHPHLETTEKLGLLGCEYLRTDLLGTIVAATDGYTLSFTADSGDIDPGIYKAGEEKNPGSELCYIGNKNSGYFHEQTCGGVETMNPKNKTEFGTRTEAVTAGYTPCPNCRP